MSFVKEFSVKTSSRTQFVNIDHIVRQAVRESDIKEGMAIIYVPHTTAAVTINENADPDVVRDITTEMDKLVPWSDNYHHMEGNSAAHIKSSLFGVSETVIITGGRLLLGTWQSIFFCEFDGPRSRTVIVKVV